MSGSPPAVANASATAPWWATPILHLVVGGMAFLGGIALIALNHPTEGDAAFGAGITFLGVGGGVGLQSATPTP